MYMLLKLTFSKKEWIYYNDTHICTCDEISFYKLPCY